MATAQQKNTAWRIIILIMGLALVYMLGRVGYEWWLERRAHFVRYEAFGIDIPSNYSIHGIDVSKYQNVIDWESVRNMEVGNVKIGFTFIKATEGNGNKDALFNRNWRKTKEAGITRGAYHFFITTKNGKQQAENFIDKVSLEAGDLPPVLDVEQTYGVSNEKIRLRVKEFLETVENHYGVRPIIYTNVDFYKQVLKDEFDEYPLWVAHYLQKERPQIYRPWHFWQHSETGRVNGIYSKVDFNVYNGDSASFKKLLIQ